MLFSCCTTTITEAIDLFLIEHCFINLLIVEVLILLLMRLHCGWRNVPWLDNSILQEHVDDKGDCWKSRKDYLGHNDALNDLKSINSSTPTRSEFGEKEKYYKSTYKELTCCGYILESFSKIFYFASYVCAITMNLRALLLMDLSIESFEFWKVIIGTSCTTTISVYLVLLICVQFFRLPPTKTAFIPKAFVPFVLSSGIRLFLDLHKDINGQYTFTYIFIALFLSFVLLESMLLLTRVLSVKTFISWWFFRFLRHNFYTSEGAYKKLVRLFDTLGSCFGLICLVIGIFSLLMDQYDFEFEAEGDLKDVVDGLQSFAEGVKTVADAVKEVIRHLDFNVTCEAIYTALASGSVAAFVTSIIPGASSVANIGGRGAYYTVKAGSALSRLAAMLKNSAKNLWKVTNVIFKISKFLVKNFKTFTIGGSSGTLLRLLPLLAPVDRSSCPFRCILAQKSSVLPFISET